MKSRCSAEFWGDCNTVGSSQLFLCLVLEEAVASESGTENPLVTVTFQRDANRKQKYLEAEPKALGITQILLSVHLISCVSIFPAKHRYGENIIPFIVASVLVLIAGGVAIAAKNLHLPTLRSTLGVQIFSSAACFFNVIWLVIDIETYYPRCWHYDQGENSTAALMCHAIEVSSKFHQPMLGS
uniref:Uncharacterized protein n=1 Tax=Hippocampus comes TaxID=109280 RepID=A0A3Q3DD27_HIPCM